MSLPDLSLSVHDAYRLEWKCVYDFGGRGGWARYRVETWFVLPRSLGVTRGGYDSSRFYTSVQHYLRLKTPAVRLRDVLTEADPVWKAWRRGVASDDAETLVERTRMLANVFKSACRDEAAAGGRAVDALAAASARFKDLPRREPSFGRRLRDSVILRKAWDRCDEYVSLLAEKTCLQVLEEGRHGRFRRRWLSLARTESAWRRRRGFPDAEEMRRNPAAFLMRFGRLKKEIAGALFLYASRFDRRRAVESVWVAVSAAVAMSAFLLVSYFANWRFAPFSAPFVTLLVAGYVFKDRLKAFLKEMASAKVLATAFDTETVIRSPDRSGTPVGSLRETVFFSDRRHLPSHPERPEEPPLSPFLEDTVLCYVRDLRLFRPALRRSYPLFSALKEIVRWNVNDLLVRMDDPETVLWRLEGRRVRRLRTLRVYPVGIVMRVSADGGPARVRSYRLELDRNGIVGLQELAGGLHPSFMAAE